MKHLAAFLLVIAGLPAGADPADIVDARFDRTGDGWRVSVTLRHGDTGWDDYADGWRIETLDGAVLGTRELLHPHVEEQPFTRSLSGVSVPSGLSEVAIRASTLPEDWAAETRTFALPEE